MIYGSVCSGIEAASVAWEPLGWKPAWFAEIEPFPSAVLAHRFPGVPNLGDFTTIGAEHGPVDLLVGGTPCQSFSIAGLRGGMADARGNLALEFLRLAERVHARWVVWENVPGVLSSNGGRDFGSILGGLAELGYGTAYRVLDAQFFGVAQRRRRVFVVGCLGNWRAAAAVLLEPGCLQGNPPPSRQAREEVAGTLGGGSGSRGWCNDLDRAGAFIPEVARTLNTSCERLDTDVETFIARGFNAEGSEGFTLTRSNVGNHINNQTPLVPSRTTVRRLLPSECEALQGFERGWTLIPWRRGEAPDGPRYKAIGNSMAVPVMRWIGRRIDVVDAVLRASREAA